VQEAVQIRYEKLAEDVSLPEKSTGGAGAYDIRAYLKNKIVLAARQRSAIPTGLRFEIPDGFVLSVRPRSGLAIKEGLTMINSPGTIDSDFRGEVQILVVNLGENEVTISPNDRIAQVILERAYTIDWVEEDLNISDRGENGFGSTGRK